MNELKFAWRQLLKNPGFTAVAVLTLALGIGANTAIFSLVNAILLRPLPYKDPGRLVMVFENHASDFKLEVSAPMLGEWRRQSTVFEGLAARGGGSFILIGCANIANLLLARSSGRAREFAIRAALGAGRWQVIRQLLAEGLVLAGAGALGGLGIASTGLELLLRLAPSNLPRVEEGVSLDGPALGFTALVALTTGMLFGLAPALQASSPALARQLTESTRGTAGRRRQTLRSAMVVAGIALSLMLLVGAGLLIRSFAQVLAKPSGFTPEHVVTMQLALPDRKYPEHADRERLFSQLHERVKAIPGVQSAGLVLGLPLAENQMGIGVWIRGSPTPSWRSIPSPMRTRFCARRNWPRICGSNIRWWRPNAWTSSCRTV